MFQQTVWCPHSAKLGGIAAPRLAASVSSPAGAYNMPQPYRLMAGCKSSRTSRLCSSRIPPRQTAAPVKGLMVPATARHNVGARFSRPVVPLHLTRCTPKLPTPTEYSRPGLSTGYIVSTPVPTHIKMAADQLEGVKSCDIIEALGTCSSIGTSTHSSDGRPNESAASSRKTPMAVAALRAATASAAAAAAATAAAGALQKEVDRLTHELQRKERCVVCTEAPRQVCFQPCGHCCTCLACAERLTCCAVCRSPVNQRLRAYLD